MGRTAYLPRCGILVIASLARTRSLRALAKDLHIKLPALHVLPRLLVGNHDHELRNLSTGHPFVELRHDLLDVCLDLVIRRNYCTVRPEAKGMRCSMANGPKLDVKTNQAC